MKQKQISDTARQSAFKNLTMIVSSRSAIKLLTTSLS